MERRIHNTKKKTPHLYSLGCNNPRQTLYSAQNRNKWAIVRIKI